MANKPTLAPHVLLSMVTSANEGNHKALEGVVLAIKDDIYRIAMRFLWHPQDAEDATQEILIKIVTRLASFRGDSQFSTWVYRLACNHLLSLKRKPIEKAGLSFEAFGEDLSNGLDEDAKIEELDDLRLIDEVKIGCTHAMLICLNRDHRMAYILGDILELEHGEAAQVLGISSSTYRKRLSRARSKVTEFMWQHCGLINATNPCRCHKRIKPAIAGGRVDPERLIFASSSAHTERIPKQPSVAELTQAKQQINQLETARNIASLYRSNQIPLPSSLSEGSEGVLNWLKRAIAEPH